jgi:hypothetical protein
MTCQILKHVALLGLELKFISELKIIQVPQPKLAKVFDASEATIVEAKIL